MDLAAIAAYLKDETGADAVTVEGGEKLVGGAIQQNLALTIAVEGGPRAGRYGAPAATTRFSDARRRPPSR